MRHLISADQLEREDIERLCDMADKIRENPQKFSKILSGKIVATLFYEPSTRTRLSFESAIMRLGGRIISTENASENSSGKKGETVSDTIRIVQSYADAIVIRHSDENSAENAVKVAEVPIINAGSGKNEHPTQALLDIYTFRSSKGHIDGLSVAMLGDLMYGRTSHSLVKLLGLYDDITIYELSDERLRLPEEYVTLMKSKGVKHVRCGSFDDIPRDVDVFYQTRVQKERMGEQADKLRTFDLTTSIMNKFSDDSIIMHPLPRNDEISIELDEDKRAMFFEQAKNGLYARMALLYEILFLG
ncbi:MAG: aspartate carbamoyltransferase [Clostridiales bacterium]|jgi:aspartate carbamoyltransferase catalytic subunit|nr:aspartate carbamoyltransferase [Clostridiales bacterium]